MTSLLTQVGYAPKVRGKRGCFDRKEEGGLRGLASSRGSTSVVRKEDTCSAGSWQHNVETAATSLGGPMCAAVRHFRRFFVIPTDAGGRWTDELHSVQTVLERRRT